MAIPSRVQLATVPYQGMARMANITCVSCAQSPPRIIVQLTDHLQQSPPVEPSEFEKKKQTFITRTIWTFVMIGMFLGALFAGHIYIIIIITAVQIVSFKEVISIIDVPSRARSLRFTKALNWYFLGVAMYFLYGESVLYYFKHIVLVDRILLPFATHHRFISFVLYIFGEHSHKLTWSHTNKCVRLCFLCRLASERPLPLPIHPVCLDTFGTILDRRAGTLCRQQRF